MNDDNARRWIDAMYEEPLSVNERDLVISSVA